MQKKIIALAVAAAFSAPAFADVTFYGLVDAAIVNVSGDGQKSDLLAWSGGLSGSRLGVKITEGLDNGMTAVAVAEYALDTQKSDGVGSARQEMLAVAGDFGTVAAGYLQTAVYDFNAKYDPTFGSAVSPIQSVAKGGGFLQDAANRASRAVAYISPKFNNVTVAVNYASAMSDTSGNLTVPSGNTAGLKTTAFILSGAYDQGPLSVGAVYSKTSNDSTPAVATASEMLFGVSYDLGMAKVMGTYASDSAGAATKVTNTMFSLSGVMPMGGGALAATYSANSMNATGSNGKGFMVGYLHNLSKTTTAYAAFENVKSSTNIAYSVVNNGVTTNLTAGGSSNLFAVGLRKKF